MNQVLVLAFHEIPGQARDDVEFGIPGQVQNDVLRKSLSAIQLIIFAFFFNILVMIKQADILSEFLDKDTIKALSVFLDKDKEYEPSADLIATAFGSSKSITKLDDDGISKLLASFKNNLTLLIQKTWVEKSDITLKDQLLYQLDILLKDNSWKEDYELFLQVINQAVFLMFGQNPESTDFAEYTLRIDPEFGIFWWYISNLPPKADWSEDKCRVAMLLGMYFLANY